MAYNVAAKLLDDRPNIISKMVVKDSQWRPLLLTGGILHPKEFYQEFVAPAVAEWQGDKLNRRRATIAVAEIDNLAEHCIQRAYPGISRQQLAQKRTDLGNIYEFLSHARDMHDTHKHGPLSRRTALITSGNRPIEEYVGGAFDDSAFGPEVFDVGDPGLVIELDNGTKIELEKVINDAVKFWTAILSL